MSPLPRSPTRAGDKSPVTSRYWLLLPALVCYVADIGLTLGGQSPAYWRGDRGRVEEINPLAGWLLSVHPVAFLAAAVAWAAAFAAVILSV